MTRLVESRRLRIHLIDASSIPKRFRCRRSFPARRCVSRFLGMRMRTSTHSVPNCTLVFTPIVDVLRCFFFGLCFSVIRTPSYVDVNHSRPHYSAFHLHRECTAVWRLDRAYFPMSPTELRECQGGVLVPFALRSCDHAVFLLSSGACSSRAVVSTGASTSISGAPEAACSSLKRLADGKTRDSREATAEL